MTAIDCGRPCPPTNGKVYFSSTTGGSKAVQTCNGGLKSVTIECTSEGWSEPLIGITSHNQFTKGTGHSMPKGSAVAF